jgi:hypothetical protein
MKKIATILLFFFTGTITVLAQNLSIDNVQKIVLRNTDAIKEGTEVKGYYFFYVSDKIDKHTNEYTLQITDNNLKKLKDIKFEDSKKVSILESSFNGTDLIFLFYNDDENTFEYKVYGADGTKKYSYTRSLSKKDERFLKMTYQTMGGDEENQFKGLYPVQGAGFISNTPSREDGDFTFEIDYFSSTNNKQWSYIPTEGGKRFSGDYLGSYNGIALFEVLRYSSRTDGNPDSYLIGLSMTDGKKIFEKPTDKAKNKFYPTNLFTLNDGRAVLFGEYFESDANVMKGKSLGFCFIGIDGKGDFISEKYDSWENDMAKYLDVSSKGRIDGLGYLFMQSSVQAADGSIYIIGEGFKKVASGLGIAANVLSGGAGSGLSNSKIKVTNLAIIKFDKEFNVKAATLYEKNSNNIELPEGFGWYGVIALGKVVKYNFGGFDYSYTQINKDNSSFTVCYKDYVKEKDYKGSTFNAITYNGDKFTKDVINTKSEASSSTVLPSKQGSVLMLEYFKKKKILEAHIEKLN